MLKELSEDLSSIKKTQSKIKDTLIKVKKNLQENKTSNQYSKKTKESEKRIQKQEDSISSFWDNFKMSNIFIIGVPEGEEKEQEIGNLFEKIMKENFPNFW